MIRNYLKGTEGDLINTIIAATAFNIMKKLRKIRESILFVLNQLIRYWSGICLTTSWKVVFADDLTRDQAIEIVKKQLQKAKDYSRVMKVVYALQMDELDVVVSAP